MLLVTTHFLTGIFHPALPEEEISISYAYSGKKCHPLPVFPTLCHVFIWQILQKPRAAVESGWSLLMCLVIQGALVQVKKIWASTWNVRDSEMVPPP